MHSFSLIAAFGALTTLVSASPITERATLSAAFKEPLGTGAFYLETIVTAGNPFFSGLFLNPYHTGAGENALVAGNGQSGSQKFTFNKTTGDIQATLGTIQYSVQLTKVGDLYAPPTGYHFVGFQPGTNSNLSFTQPGNYLQFPQSGYIGAGFAICPAEIYSPGVYVQTLVYHLSGAPKNSTCADVKVKAIF